MILESEIQRNIVKRYEADGWLVVKIIQCNKNGWPDLMVMRKGMVEFIEVKRPGFKLRPLQEYRRKEIEAQGFEFKVLTR